MVRQLLSLLRSWLCTVVGGTSVSVVVPLTVPATFGNWEYQLTQMAQEQRTAVMRVALDQLVRDTPTEWFMDNSSLVPSCDAEHMAR
jgi:hypothetical protein